MKIEINSEEKILIDCLHSINEDGIYWFEYVLDDFGRGWMQLCFQYTDACYYNRTLKINYDDSSLCFSAARLDSYYNYEDFTLKECRY